MIFNYICIHDKTKKRAINNDNDTRKWTIWLYRSKTSTLYAVTRRQSNCWMDHLNPFYVRWNHSDSSILLLILLQTGKMYSNGNTLSLSLFENYSSPISNMAAILKCPFWKLLLSLVLKNIILNYILIEIQRCQI